MTDDYKYNYHSINLERQRIEKILDEYDEDFQTIDLKIKLMILECLNEIASGR